MQLSSIPSKIAAIFAASGTKNAIPLTTAGVANPNNASMDVGFPPITMLPVPSGGLPPFGADFNGILNAMTAVQQWLNAGGLFPYDAAFSSAIGGYPKGSLLLMASGLGTWRSQVDNNVSNPDTGGANWDQLVNLSQFPSVQGASGSETLPNGLIRKWGQFNGSTGGPTSVTFPVAFPTNCFAVTFGGLYASGALIPTLDSTPTKTGFTASTYLVSGSRTNQAAYWEAIGN